MTTEETTTTRKSADDAKKRTDREPEAVKKARRKVEKNIDEDMPGPVAEHVDSAPDTKPSE